MTENEKKISLGAIALAVILAGVLLWDGQNVVTEHKAGSEAQLQTNQQEQQSTNTIKYQGEEGKTALELLKQNYTVGTQEYNGIGEFVTSINGIEAGSTHFWAFYVNDQLAKVGASQYKTEDGDVIEWKLEKIQN